MRILVVGASGLLGHSLVPKLRSAGHGVIAHGNNSGQDVEGDLTKANVTHEIISRICPEVVINLVALTDVDGCERERDEAYRLNVKVVEALVASLAKIRGAHLVQLSTDQVYDRRGPHAEKDVCLTNTYALSKYAGELAAQQMPATVLRTNFFGQSRLTGRASFSDWLETKFKAREPFIGFDDVRFSALSMETLTSMILKVVQERRKGVFNLGAREGMSKADFAVLLAEHMGLDSSNMTRGCVHDANLSSYRPKDMRMKCERFEAAFDVELPTLAAEVASEAGRRK